MKLIQFYFNLPHIQRARGGRERSAAGTTRGAQGEAAPGGGIGIGIGTCICIGTCIGIGIVIGIGTGIGIGSSIGCW